METRRNISPWSTFFLGMWVTGSVAIAAGTIVVLSGMSFIDGKIASVFDLGRDVAGNVPEILETLKPVLGDAFQDERSPEYRASLEVSAKFPVDGSGRHARPSLTIRNTGEQIVSRLVVRIAALDAFGATRHVWTEVVATPLALCNELPGPLLPGNDHPRYALASDGPWIRQEEWKSLTLAVEVADLYVWKGDASTVATASLRP